MSLLKLPSHKVFAKHLENCVNLTANTNQNVNSPQAACLPKDIHTVWRCQLPFRSFNLSTSVWIQGIVVQVEDCGKMVAVDDGTGIIILMACDKISSKISVMKGMYIMAVGALQTGGHCPVIKPIKLQDLSCMEHAETMWPLEVVDQINFLNGWPG